MKSKFFFLPQALEDLERAAEWYEAISSQMRFAFLSDLETVLERIQDFPLSAPLYRDGIHRALFSKFPYGLFYLADRGTVKVLAVFHLMRDTKAIAVRNKP